MLSRLIKKKELVVIGLNSGTSADGLDLAAVRIDLTARKSQIRLSSGKTVRYPPRLSSRIASALADGWTSLDDIIRLDRQLGAFYGEQAAEFCSYLKRKKITVDLVSSHGQTIRHLPGRITIRRKKESGTLQLGHPESISERTGLVTVSDFRQADIASGGEGAPITVYPMWLMFSDRRENRMIINIGGIANYFLFSKKSSPDESLAADCGPGNSLLDIISRKYFGQRFDREGRLAAKGTISKRFLAILLADDYLKGKYGPSTGRERFGEKFVKKMLENAARLKLSRFDVMATTTELTAIAISNSANTLLHRYGIRRVYLFGGGLRNKFLLSRLRANLPKIELHSLDALGFNPDYLEAACYAVMGAMTIRSLPAGLPHITGAASKTIAGRIIQPATIK